MYHLQIALSDVDRGVYEQLDLRLARHPSESMRYLLTRLIAYCLLHEEGIAFTRGLAEAEEPAVWVKSMQGELRLWCDIGNPAPERLHRASKAADRVVVFTHLDPEMLRRQAQGKTVFRGDALEIHVLPPAFLDALDKVTDRNARWELVRSEGLLYVTVGGKVIEGAVTSTTLVTPGESSKK
jgi:uncharacterized protein YaeQ